jgi:hypothetical protein
LAGGILRALLNKKPNCSGNYCSAEYYYFPADCNFRADYNFAARYYFAARCDFADCYWRRYFASRCACSGEVRAAFRMRLLRVIRLFVGFPCFIARPHRRKKAVNRFFGFLGAVLQRVNFRSQNFGFAFDFAQTREKTILRVARLPQTLFERGNQIFFV